MPSKVLIADDSLKVQKELTALLKGAGVEVVTVSNGEHAVRKLASVQPDLVLADIFMPVRTGYEVCDYIKASAEFGHVRVLLLASKMEPYDEKEAQRVRADGKIEKPFADPAAVLATIQQHLEKAASRKPVPPAPPIEEFAATVAAAPEPEPEPEPETSSRPAPVSFGAAAPMGFADAVEESHPPPPAGERTTVEKPELAAAWEMTGPQPGAPPVPVVGGFDSQWSGGGEEAAAREAPAEPASEKPYAPEDFAADFGATAAAPPPAPVEEAPAAVEEVRAAIEEAVAAASPGPAAPDPAVVEQVVNQVLARLSPQVMESIAREIVRPLAESLLKEKPKN